MIRNILLIIICSGLFFTANAQPGIGIPAIKNYTYSDYNASAEIFGVCQDKNGILYFANNDGLLTFDGSYWKIYPLPNKAAIKSLAIDPSGRIYVGGQDEVGYFFPDKEGILKFHSIKQMLPVQARQFADIWNVVLFNNEVFFRTIECLFEYNGNKIRTFDAYGGWRLLTQAGNQLYAEDKDKGLMIFNRGQWLPCCGKMQTAELHITALSDYRSDTLLVATSNKGLFCLTGSSLQRKTTAADAVLRNDIINCCKKIGKNEYAISTTANGVLIIDGSGKLLRQFSNNEGLQNNDVHAILSDADNNLWLGLENGVGFVDYNTAITHIYPSRKQPVKG